MIAINIDRCVSERREVMVSVWCPLTGRGNDHSATITAAEDSGVFYGQSGEVTPSN